MALIDVNNIFAVSPDSDHFCEQSLSVFRFQYHQNRVYRQWCDLHEIEPNGVKTLKSIPSLPISFFKSHAVCSTEFIPENVFESSGTGQTGTSRHFVKDLSVYEQSFLDCFNKFYGNPQDWCILGLLPSYLERQHSSLVMMVDALIKVSRHPQSGFYLDEHKKLSKNLSILEKQEQKTLLIGVTFGLLDFAAEFPQKLKHTIVMETGGMKGRQKEITRKEVHKMLSEKLGVAKIHSEYGMTELLSQAYSAGDGRFICPPWMKVMIREVDDPLQISNSGTGLLTIIDLANIYSCSFIATDDVGNVYEDGSFEVLGRLDNSDLRGCSLMVV